jgi:hypothetical protein
LVILRLNQEIRRPIDRTLHAVAGFDCRRFDTGETAEKHQNFRASVEKAGVSEQPRSMASVLLDPHWSYQHAVDEKWCWEPTKSKIQQGS